MQFFKKPHPWRIIRYSLFFFSPIFRLTYELCHGSHRTIYAPAPRFEQYHCDKSQNRWCEHNTIETECKLCNSLMKYRSMICPVPRKLKRPQKYYHLTKVFRTRMQHNHPHLQKLCASFSFSFPWLSSKNHFLEYITEKVLCSVMKSLFMFPL